jgi:SAM-dependent methyltransferase
VTFVQRDQPPGVPPLVLDGERTLPDVPEENYWYRRHLAVYEWIAPRVAGLHVVDLASGEGYGAAVLARRALSVVGIEPNPDAFSHACARYPEVDFRRDIAETFVEPCDAVAFLQTIEHVADPDLVLEQIRSQLRPGGVAYVSTPNVLTLAPPGAARSDNPWHVREYMPSEFHALCSAHFDAVELLGVFHARVLRAHETALRLGWDRVHRALRVTKPFYDRLVPAISSRDFAVRAGRLERALDLVAVLR